MSRRCGRFAREERASLLPLTVLLTLVFVVAALPVASAGYIEGTRWLTQRAADAAALAGAMRQVIRRRVDARGVVYCETVAVDPVAGPAAASQYWSRDTASQPSLKTRRFSAVADGSTITVRAGVRAPGGGLLLAGQPTVSWSVRAEAEDEPTNVSAIPPC